MKYVLALIVTLCSISSYAQSAKSVSDMQPSEAELRNFDIDMVNVKDSYIVRDVSAKPDVDILRGQLREDKMRAALIDQGDALRFYAYGMNKETVCDCTAQKGQKLIYFYNLDGSLSCKVLN